VKHLGLSCAHGEVSSFASLRLAFWGSEEDEQQAIDSSNDAVSQDALSLNPNNNAASSRTEFLPHLPQHPLPITATTTDHNDKDDNSTPLLTPFDHQGSLRSSTASIVRSPFVQSYAPKQSSASTARHQQQPQQQQLIDPPPPPQYGSTPRIKNFVTPPRNPSKQTHTAATAIAAGDGIIPPPPFPSVISSNHMTPSSSKSCKASASLSSSSEAAHKIHVHSTLQPHHYAQEIFKSTTVPNDSNPIWSGSGDDTSNNDSTHHNSNQNNNNNFHIPLYKNDLLPTLQTDGAKITLDIRLDEQMTQAESLLVDGALSSAVTVASVATSMVGMGQQTKVVSNIGREMLGLGSDRLIGRGVVDLMPLLVGLWEEDWEENNGVLSFSSCSSSDQNEEEDATLDVLGRIPSSARMMRRRVERMGVLDVWVPLHHPADASNGLASDGKEDSATASSAGKVHLRISYEPNGMSPKRDDVVALESFARRPFEHVNGSGGNGSGGVPGGNNNTAFNLGSVINPILPTLSPFLVIDRKGSYLLLEYATSRTVTSVDRHGNIKSSRWERTHRVRIHRNSVFVIERRTLLDVAGDIARLPGDIVLSTTVGQEIAEASAPVVAGVLELMTPAFQSVKLLMGAGSLGVRASLAGAKAASSAVASVSQQKAMERREGVYLDEREGSDSGVYQFG